MSYTMSQSHTFASRLQGYADTLQQKYVNLTKYKKHIIKNIFLIKFDVLVHVRSRTRTDFNATRSQFIHSSQGDL